jgi:uncharacterized repeat protein (TIGR01451 family)
MVVCTDDHNQYISEGELIEDEPATPDVSFTKTDGLTTTGSGQTLTYDLAFHNGAAGADAGPATEVVVSDQLPALTAYEGCEIVAPFTGSCGLVDGEVMATLDQPIGAGESGSIKVSVTVLADPPPGASVVLHDVATLTHEDGLGNPFPTLTATDDTTVLGPEL